MRAASFLAVDLGAESGRVLRVDWGAQELAFHELRRFPNRPLWQGGNLTWNLGALFAEIVAGLGAAAQSGPAPQSIGVDTWGIDYALLGADGRLLAAPYCYRDGRVSGVAATVWQTLGRERLYALTGLQELPFNTLYQLAADRRGGGQALFAAAEKILFIPDALHYWLSGRLANEYTIASTSQLLNVSTKRFEPEILDYLGLTPETFGPLVAPGTPLGPLTARLTAQTGLDPKTELIAVACHDTASAVAAMPSDAPLGEVAYLSSGTWSLLGVEIERPLLTPAARQADLTHEGGVGGRLRLLKNCTGLWLVQRLKAAFDAERSTPLSYAELAAAAAESTPFCAFVDPDDPSFLNPPDMRLAIDAYLARSGQSRPQGPGGYARLLFESLAFRYRQILAQIAQVTGSAPKRLHIVGGGARNTLLNQLTADALGLPVLAGPYEATALGNALMQALACGLIGSVEEGRRRLARLPELTPFLPRHDPALERAFHRFQTLTSQRGDA